MSDPPADRLPDAEGWQRLGGGDVASVWRATWQGREVVVKVAPYPASVEADGLAALAEAGAAVPEVLAVDAEMLVLAAVDGPPDWPRLGRTLAGVHRHVGDAYGWHMDNRIGPLVQSNGWLEEWPAFYAERRIRPHLDAPALPRTLRTRLERALHGPLVELLAHRCTPSLVHGDLWSGNVVSGRWLIDPAVHYADREYELAFATLFGGLPPSFFAAYEAAWPLDDGWQARRPALQLSHLLVHVRLFGAGYAGAVAARLDALGW